MICNLCGLKEEDMGAKYSCTSQIAKSRAQVRWDDDAKHEWIDASIIGEGPKGINCNYCGENSLTTRAITCKSNLSSWYHSWVKTNLEPVSAEQATRTPLDVRYDLIEASFLRAMAQVGQHGAVKFGEGNYKLSRMKGKDSPANHIMNHLGSYILSEQYNHPEIGHDRKYHLAAIAFNAMMEFYYEEQGEKS